MAGNTTEWEFTGDSKILKKAIEDAITVFKGLDNQSKGTTEAIKKLETQLDGLSAGSKGAGKGVDGLDDKLKGLGKTSKTSTINIAAMREQVGEVGDTAGDVDSILMGMTGVLEKIDPRLAQVATTAGEMAAGIESVSRVIATANPVMLAIMGVALAVSVAYTAYSETADKAAKESEDLATANEKVEKSFKDLEAQTSDLSGRLQVGRGEVTQWDADLNKVHENIKAKYAPEVQNLSDLYFQQNMKLMELKDNIVNVGVKAYNKQAKLVRNLKKDMDSLDRTVDNLISGEQELIDIYYSSADAIKAAATAAKEKAEQEAAWLEASNKRKEAEKSLIEQADAARVATLATHEQIRDAYFKQIDAIDATLEKTKQTPEQEALASAAIVDLRTKYNADIAKLDEDLAAKQKAIADKAKKVKEDADKADERALEKLKAQGFAFDDVHEKGGRWIDKIKDLRGELAELAEQELAGIDTTEHYEEVVDKLADTFEELGEAASKSSTFMADMFGDAITLMMMQSEELTDKQKEQIMLLYRAQQTAAITTIGIDTMVAATKALAELGPIAGPIAAGAMVASGAINAGIVAATPPPEFHIGGIIPSSSTLVNALPGESILNRETTAQLGAGGVASLNSGGAGGAMVIEQVYGHRVFNRFIVDNLAAGGPLKKQIVGNTRVGHRVRSTS
jgi:chromosome segregation ATPase